MLTAAKGPVDLDEFRSLFELFDPDEVHKWVEATIKKAQATKRLPLIMVLSALEEIGFSDPDAITTSVVARHMRSTHGTKDFPTNADVKDVIYGLSVLVPHLVRLANEAIILGTSPAKIRLAVLTQLQEVPPEYRLGIDQVLNTKSA